MIMTLSSRTQAWSHSSFPHLAERHGYVSCNHPYIVDMNNCKDSLSDGDNDSLHSSNMSWQDRNAICSPSGIPLGDYAVLSRRYHPQSSSPNSIDTGFGSEESTDSSQCNNTFDTVLSKSVTFLQNPSSLVCHVSRTSDRLKSKPLKSILKKSSASQESLIDCHVAVNDALDKDFSRLSIHNNRADRSCVERTAQRAFNERTSATSGMKSLGLPQRSFEQFQLDDVSSGNLDYENIGQEYLNYDSGDEKSVCSTFKHSSRSCDWKDSTVGSMPLRASKYRHSMYDLRPACRAVEFPKNEVSNMSHVHHNFSKSRLSWNVTSTVLDPPVGSRRSSSYRHSLHHDSNISPFSPNASRGTVSSIGSTVRASERQVNSRVQNSLHVQNVPEYQGKYHVSKHPKSNRKPSLSPKEISHGSISTPCSRADFPHSSNSQSVVFEVTDLDKDEHYKVICVDDKVDEDYGFLTYDFSTPSSVSLQSYSPFARRPHDRVSPRDSPLPLQQQPHKQSVVSCVFTNGNNNNCGPEVRRRSCPSSVASSRNFASVCNMSPGYCPTKTKDSSFSVTSLSHSGDSSL